MPAITEIEPQTTKPGYHADLDELIDKLGAIRLEMLDLEAAALGDNFDLHDSYGESARNLLHYLALRRHDLRPIQERLAANGLSSRVHRTIRRGMEVAGTNEKFEFPPGEDTATTDSKISLQLREQLTSQHKLLRWLHIRSRCSARVDL